MAEPGANTPLLCLLDAPAACLIKQGAEAKVYRVPLYTEDAALALPAGRSAARTASTTHVLLKHRFFKRYRHPALSASVTASRTVMEARSLVRCARHGVRVPRVELVDETHGVLGLEWIEDISLRRWLGGVPEGDGVEEPSSADNVPAPSQETQRAYRIGR